MRVKCTGFYLVSASLTAAYIWVLAIVRTHLSCFKENSALQFQLDFITVFEVLNSLIKSPIILYGVPALDHRFVYMKYVVFF